MLKRIPESELREMQEYNWLDSQTRFKNRLLDGIDAAYEEIDTQADEMKWYRSLEIVREEEGITGIDDGRKAQMLHEMWEENVRLEAELEKRPGLSRGETADLFGGKMLNVAQQGVELLSRAKQIDTQAGRIKALEEGLRNAKIEEPPNSAFMVLRDVPQLIYEHNARIDALLPKEKSDGIK